MALSPKEYAKKIYAGEEDKEHDVVYYNCNPPFDDLILQEKTEIVYHACEWDKNYLSLELNKNLIDFIEKNKSTIEFSFIEGLL